MHLVDGTAFKKKMIEEYDEKRIFENSLILHNF